MWKTAAKIVRQVLERKDDLVAGHKAASKFRLDSQRDSAEPVPFPPGASSFYAEKGIKIAP